MGQIQHIVRRANGLARRLKLKMYRFKACPKCGGDLMLDNEEWLCCQCGRYYYPKPMLVGTDGRPPAAGGLGRRYEELLGAAGAGRVAVTAPAGRS